MSLGLGMTALMFAGSPGQIAHLWCSWEVHAAGETIRRILADVALRTESPVAVNEGADLIAGC